MHIYLFLIINIVKGLNYLVKKKVQNRDDYLL